MLEKVCPGSNTPIDDECGAIFCAVCEDHVTAYHCVVTTRWLANKHYVKPQGHCDCGNPIYELDYLCEICRSIAIP